MNAGTKFARYAQIQAAIQVCRRKRDAVLVPTERRQKMERIIASLQAKKDNQMQEKERLDVEQKELDVRKRANGSELQQIEDEMASAQMELNRIQQDGSVWKGSSKGRKLEAAPASTTWHIAEDDDENDDDVHQGHEGAWAEYDDWDKECDTEDSPVSDVEFNNWLQTRHPDIYDTVTVYFDWEPPTGMLDRHYSNYATEKANAEACGRRSKPKHGARAKIGGKDGSTSTWASSWISNNRRCRKTSALPMKKEPSRWQLGNRREPKVTPQKDPDSGATATNNRLWMTMKQNRSHWSLYVWMEYRYLCRSVLFFWFVIPASVADGTDLPVLVWNCSLLSSASIVCTYSSSMGRMCYNLPSGSGSK